MLTVALAAARKQRADPRGMSQDRRKWALHRRLARCSYSSDSAASGRSKRCA